MPGTALMPKIAIVGRPNVGKSTLFNRLAGKKLALVDDMPGVTRDRRSADAKLGDLEFSIIDTAGLEEAEDESLQGRMREQTQKAIEEADLCLFMIDGRAGLLPDDELFARLLRKSDKPTILVVNKVESRAAEAGYYEAYGLGFGELVPISAEHGQGLADLYDALKTAFEQMPASDDPYAAEGQAQNPLEDQEAIIDGEIFQEPEYDAQKPLRIAVVGRPNAGKSTLINQLIGDDRLLTGPEAGITRDSISVDWQYQSRTIKLFDTAGMRKKARIQEKLEKLSVSDGLRAIQFAEVVVIVIDAQIPFEKQDLQIIDLVVREGRAPVIAINKWDLIEERQRVLNEIHEMAERLLPQVKGLKVVPISGKTGENIAKLMRAIFQVHESWNRRLVTAALNRWLSDVQYHHPPPAVSGRRVRLKYISQVKTRPPTFMVSSSRAEAVPTSYKRYLVNQIRQQFDLWSTPIRLFVRKTDNPYARQKK